MNYFCSFLLFRLAEILIILLVFLPFLSIYEECVFKWNVVYVIKQKLYDHFVSFELELIDVILFSCQFHMIFSLDTI